MEDTSLIIITDEWIDELANSFIDDDGDTTPPPYARVLKNILPDYKGYTCWHVFGGQKKDMLLIFTESSLVKIVACVMDCDIYDDIDIEEIPYKNITSITNRTSIKQGLSKTHINATNAFITFTYEWNHPPMDFLNELRRRMK